MPSGSPAVFVLRLPQNRAVPRTIDATHALARRGLTMLQAKRAIETLVETGSVFVELSVVENGAVLARELAAAGIAAGAVEPSLQVPDVRKLRERLRLTREQFAIRYGLDVGERAELGGWPPGARSGSAKLPAGHLERPRACRACLRPDAGLLGSCGCEAAGLDGAGSRPVGWSRILPWLMSRIRIRIGQRDAALLPRERSVPGGLRGLLEQSYGSVPVRPAPVPGFPG